MFSSHNRNWDVNLLLSHKCICEKGSTASSRITNCRRILLSVSQKQLVRLLSCIAGSATSVAEQPTTLIVCASVSHTSFMLVKKRNEPFVVCNKRLPSLVILMCSHIRSAEKPLTRQVQNYIIILQRQKRLSALFTQLSRLVWNIPKSLCAQRKPVIQISRQLNRGGRKKTYGNIRWWKIRNTSVSCHRQVTFGRSKLEANAGGGCNFVIWDFTELLCLIESARNSMLLSGYWSDLKNLIWDF